MKGILTEKIRTRMTKFGFATPEEVWMRENSKFFAAKLKEMIEWSDGIINDNALVLWNDIINKRRVFDFSIWRIISFGSWMHTFNVKA